MDISWNMYIYIYLDMEIWWNIMIYIYIIYLVTSIKWCNFTTHKGNEIWFHQSQINLEIQNLSTLVGCLQHGQPKFAKKPTSCQIPADWVLSQNSWLGVLPRWMSYKRLPIRDLSFGSKKIWCQIASAFWMIIQDLLLRFLVFLKSPFSRYF
jgi:hypothetical protein